MTEHRPEGQRIAKWIAQSGLASRRGAEELIAEGRVTVDGQEVTTPATILASPNAIAVDSNPLPKRDRVRVWRLHKPLGYLVTDKDPQGRPILRDLLPSDMPRVLAVGRLDINSEGLILLTNDGAFKRQLELPASGVERRYRARVYGRLPKRRLAALIDGIEIEGIRYGSMKVEIESQAAANSWLNLTLAEGKNREIRKVLGHLDLQVNRLIRVGYGNVSLGRLKAGDFDELGQKDLWQAFGEDFGLGVAPKSGWARAKPKARSRPRSKVDKNKPSRAEKGKHAAHHRRKQTRS